SLFFYSPSSATSHIYTLSLHDALPIYFSINDALSIPFIYLRAMVFHHRIRMENIRTNLTAPSYFRLLATYFCKFLFLFFYLLLRSEEHTSELQSRFDLVCRLLLEKKK